MKTTCLIPVPCDQYEFIEDKEILLLDKNGKYMRGHYFPGLKRRMIHIYSYGGFELSEFTHVLVPQSGYFFTEEEMNLLLKSLIEAKDGLINQSLLSIEKGQDTAGADGMATGLMLAIKRINELLTTK